MKILIDWDVLLDNLLDRSPFADMSTQVLRWAEEHPGKASVAWHSISNLTYMIKQDPADYLRDLLSHVEIPATGTMDMLHALMLEMADFEDAMQVAAAENFGAQVLVTRNLRDYAKAPIKAMTPTEFLSIQ